MVDYERNLVQIFGESLDINSDPVGLYGQDFGGEVVNTETGVVLYSYVRYTLIVRRYDVVAIGVETVD